jgi:hypothetical protein
MHTVDYIHFCILVCGIIGMIVSFLMLATNTPAERVGAEGFDDPAFKAFIISVGVVVLDVAVWLLTLLWNLTIFPHAELIGFFLVGLVAWLAVAWEKFRVKPAQKPLAPSKKPWLSKTIVLNAMVAAGLLAEANIAGLQGVLPASKYQIVAFVLPIVNMLLRAYTSQGVSFKPAAPQAEVAP